MRGSIRRKGVWSGRRRRGRGERGDKVEDGAEAGELAA